MSNSKNSNKLNAKDLVNIGIYSGIYFVVICVAAMLGCIPILYPCLAFIMPILGGIPVMLFYTKVKKPGMIFIMSVIMGIMMIFSGMGYYPLIIGVFSGIAAEIIYKSGEYKSSFKAVLSYGVFCIWVWGNYVLFFVDRASYEADRQNLGEAHLKALNDLKPQWLFFGLLVICFVSGIVGGILGKVVLKKHFKKAGIV